MGEMIAESTSHYRIHFIIIFLLVSFNLRMSFSAADPLLVFLMRDLGLSVGSSGLFGLLPIMSLGVAAPLGAVLVRYIRPRILIIDALLWAIGGVIWRSYGGITGLFGGTVVIGLGLGVAGSVILGIGKQVLPDKQTELMAAYTACVSLGTAVGAGASAPMALLLGGWQHGLLFWGLPLLIAALLWGELVLRARKTHIQQSTLKTPMLPLLKQTKARMVTLFYMFRVAGAWLLIVWLATLMRERGMPLVEAGLVLSVSTAFQIPGALLSGIIGRWMGGTDRLMISAISATIVACWGLLTAPLHLWLLFAILLGCGLGIIFSVGMALIVESEADEAGTVALSGLAQGVGFTCGGLLAWLCGQSMQLPHHNVWVGGVYTLLAIGGLICGLHALRNANSTATANKNA